MKFYGGILGFQEIWRGSKDGKRGERGQGGDQKTQTGAAQDGGSSGGAKSPP